MQQTAVHYALWTSVYAYHFGYRWWLSNTLFGHVSISSPSCFKAGLGTFFFFMMSKQLSKYWLGVFNWTFNATLSLIRPVGVYMWLALITKLFTVCFCFPTSHVPALLILRAPPHVSQTCCFEQQLRFGLMCDLQGREKPMSYIECFSQSSAKHFDW